MTEIMAVIWMLVFGDIHLLLLPPLLVMRMVVVDLFYIAKVPQFPKKYAQVCLFPMTQEGWMHPCFLWCV